MQKVIREAIPDIAKEVSRNIYKRKRTDAEIQSRETHDTYEKQVHTPEKKLHVKGWSQTIHNCKEHRLHLAASMLVYLVWTSMQLHQGVISGLACILQYLAANDLRIGARVTCFHALMYRLTWTGIHMTVPLQLFVLSCISYTSHAEAHRQIGQWTTLGVVKVKG